MDAGDGAHRAVTLRVTAGEVRILPPVQEVAYLQLGDFPLDDPDWDVGIQEVYVLPYYPTYDLQPRPLDFLGVTRQLPSTLTHGSGAARRGSGLAATRDRVQSTIQFE